MAEGQRESAWFGAASQARAAELAGLIVDARPDGSPVPDLDIRADGVRVRGTVGRSAGLIPDTGVLQELRLRFDSPAPASVTPFWRTALNYAGGDTIADPWRRCPVIRFEQSDRTGPLRNRIHVDSGFPGPIKAAVAALQAEGGREAFACEWYSTMADADGNEVDVVPGGALGDESTSDWSVLFGGMACYPGGSVALATEAAGLADAAGIPLMIDVRPEGVVFDSGKDLWEKNGFAELAAGIQATARAAGLTADNTQLRFVQALIDAVDVASVREFWRIVLGYVPAPDNFDLYDPRQLNPVILFQPMDATDTERRRQRNRIHLELLLPADQLATRVEAGVAAGGRILGEEPGRYRLGDPEGNEVLLTEASVDPLP
jgi:hypothetical protein